jgi:2-amino-4-hydroxy-6-hydroxymethyldihydropteridine diphosphokinase
MATVYLGLGANLGDKEDNILTAIRKIAYRAGIILVLSAFYENPPCGFTSGNTFVNAAACIDTSLTPYNLLNVIKKIEQEMGRLLQTTNAYQDRIIDIDILLYDNLILYDENLIIPHRLMHERKFVLKPLAEIAPTLLHPVLKKSILELSLIFM